METGCVPVFPEVSNILIPLFSAVKSINGDDCLLLSNLDSCNMNPQRNGGQIHGCEIAEFLVNRVRQVTIVDEAPEDMPGEGMTGDDKYLLFPWFDKKGVNARASEYPDIKDSHTVIVTAEAVPGFMSSCPASNSDTTLQVFTIVSLPAPVSPDP
jgi:hypothetical protein